MNEWPPTPSRRDTESPYQILGANRRSTLKERKALRVEKLKGLDLNTREGHDEAAEINRAFDEIDERKKKKRADRVKKTIMLPSDPDRLRPAPEEPSSEEPAPAEALHAAKGTEAPAEMPADEPAGMPRAKETPQAVDSIQARADEAVDEPVPAPREEAASEEAVAATPPPESPEAPKAGAFPGAKNTEEDGDLVLRDVVVRGGPQPEAPEKGEDDDDPQPEDASPPADPAPAELVPSAGAAAQEEGPGPVPSAERAASPTPEASPEHHEAAAHASTETMPASKKPKRPGAHAAAHAGAHGHADGEHDKKHGDHKHHGGSGIWGVFAGVFGLVVHWVVDGLKRTDWSSLASGLGSGGGKKGGGHGHGGGGGGHH